MVRGRGYPTTPVTIATVSKKEKYCHAPWKARTIFGWLEEGAPIWNTHAMGAGKNRGENRGWGYPSFITGQPGILVELTGVTQPIFMKWVTHVMSVTS